jgi:hypothetical protein
MADRVEVEIYPTWDGRQWRLHLFHEGRYIGEYEASRAAKHTCDLEAKIAEAVGASALLIAASEQTESGRITVRWHSKLRAKEIRHYRDGQHDPGVGAAVIDTIPTKPFWRKP